MGSFEVLLLISAKIKTFRCAGIFVSSAKQSGGVSGGYPPSICDKARNKKTKQMGGFIFAEINNGSTVPPDRVYDLEGSGTTKTEDNP